MRERGEVAIGILALCALAVFVFGYITADQAYRKQEDGRIKVVLK